MVLLVLLYLKLTKFKKWFCFVLTKWIKPSKHRGVNVFKLETQTRHGMWHKVKLVESSEGGSRRGDLAKYSTAHQEH